MLQACLCEGVIDKVGHLSERVLKLVGPHLNLMINYRAICVIPKR